MSHEDIKEYLEIEKSLQSQPKSHRLYVWRVFFHLFKCCFTQRGKYFKEQTGRVKINMLTNRPP